MSATPRIRYLWRVLDLNKGVAAKRPSRNDIFDGPAKIELCRFRISLADDSEYRTETSPLRAHGISQAFHFGAHHSENAQIRATHCAIGPPSFSLNAFDTHP